MSDSRRVQAQPGQDSPQPASGERLTAARTVDSSPAISSSRSVDSSQPNSVQLTKPSPIADSAQPSASAQTPGRARPPGPSPVPVPVRSLDPAALSLADRKRQAARPWRWVLVIAGILIVIILPYWYGRNLAISQTGNLLAILTRFDPRGLLLVAWLTVVVFFAALGATVAGWHRRTVAAVTFMTFAAQQFLAGCCLLKSDFWYSTYVVFHDNAVYANAIGLGIIAAAVGFGLFAILFVLVLIFIRPSSRFNILTSAASALASYLVVELLALTVVLFGGLIGMV